MQVDPQEFARVERLVDVVMDTAREMIRAGHVTRDQMANAQLTAALMLIIEQIGAQRTATWLRGVAGTVAGLEPGEDLSPRQVLQ